MEGDMTSDMYIATVTSASSVRVRERRRRKEGGGGGQKEDM